MKVPVAYSCPTLCDPIDGSPPASSVHEILQARILERIVLPYPGIKPTSPALQVDSLPLELPGKPMSWPDSLPNFHLGSLVQLVFSGGWVEVICVAGTAWLTSLACKPGWLRAGWAPLSPYCLHAWLAWASSQHGHLRDFAHVHSGGFPQSVCSKKIKAEAARFSSAAGSA